MGSRPENCRLHLHAHAASTLLGSDPSSRPSGALYWDFRLKAPGLSRSRPWALRTDDPPYEPTVKEDFRLH